MYFPEELKQSVIMGHFMGQIRLATINGLKGKDDCLDTISMLGYLKPWKPSIGLTGVGSTHSSDADFWGDERDDDEPLSISNYIV